MMVNYYDMKRQAVQKHERRTVKAILISFQGDEEQLINKILSILPEDVEIIRATQEQGEPDILVFPGLTIHIFERRVFRGDREISLTRLEFDILLYLARNAEQALSHEQIYSAVWHEDVDDYDNAVVCAIYRIRKKLKSNSEYPIHIETIEGYGYKLSFTHH